MQNILRSRRRVLLATVALLILLDLGRSLYAHTGYAQPVELWQPDPKLYADIAWPPGSDLPPMPRTDRACMPSTARCVTDPMGVAMAPLRRR